MPHVAAKRIEGPKGLGYNYPWNRDETYRQLFKNERKHVDNFNRMWETSTHPVQQREAELTLPRVGRKVRLSGVKRREELEGLVGEVLSHDTDEDGRISIRVCMESTGPGDSVKWKRMMVRPTCLEPLPLTPSQSAPQLHPATCYPKRWKGEMAWTGPPKWECHKSKDGIFLPSGPC
eukprot:gnl/TRDRNA2_/TRDRNA2_187390_c0_seq1.p1 gnl/TRDRNA2_/TRDRNA2_187390_c0~~gnl/TRDRNA2_/TRDRNA2_187390_c0_seq1.p1  ORF type:complete len:177 (-),score=23.78 gnl/TRDRNA2_/TRDRNA2_187390_c0_seq1:90-620(-)